MSQMTNPFTRQTPGSLQTWLALLPASPPQGTAHPACSYQEAPTSHRTHQRQQPPQQRQLPPPLGTGLPAKRADTRSQVPGTGNMPPLISHPAWGLNSSSQVQNTGKVLLSPHDQTRTQHMRNTHTHTQHLTASIHCGPPNFCLHLIGTPDVSWERLPASSTLVSQGSSASTHA